MKYRIIALLTICLLLAGCAAEPKQAATATEPETSAPITEQTAAPTVTDAPQNTETIINEEEIIMENANKTLVVYYSATGNTERVAKAIAEASAADVFALVPVQPYTSDDLDWTNDNSRSSLEYAHPETRNVELAHSVPDNWDAYATVFVGYPIWWGVAAWPVDTFIKANDFAGKTVIPFCTSGSSGLGQSGKLLSEMAGVGEWQGGMRFRSGVSDEDVQAWVKSLER